MTLAEALEAALNGTATRADVIKAIDAELSKGYEMNLQHEPRNTNNRQLRREIRRDYINYFLDHPEKYQPFMSLREAVRFVEIAKCGCQLPNYYPER